MVRLVILCAALAAAVLIIANPGCGGKTTMAEQERKGAVTFKGSPLTLIGKELKVGDKAPDFTVTAQDLSPVSFSSFKGKVCIVTSVPSLDTSVCDIMTRRFAKEAVALGDKVAVITVSMDLPFAQKRWCVGAEVKEINVLSDYKDASFGKAWGLLIKELHLEARAVYVIDASGVVRYAQVVPEMTHEPDYDAAIAAAKKCL
jgi:thioredoxin-dependent peroxiredoxin